MTTKVTLLTSQESFEAMHELADRRRSRPVAVDRQRLLDLLIDHTVMAAALTAIPGVKVINPEPKRERLRLTNDR